LSSLKLSNESAGKSDDQFRVHRPSAAPCLWTFARSRAKPGSAARAFKEIERKLSARGLWLHSGYQACKSGNADGRNKLDRLRPNR
jgi:hypothetical protein